MDIQGSEVLWECPSGVGDVVPLTGCAHNAWHLSSSRLAEPLEVDNVIFSVFTLSYNSGSGRSSRSGMFPNPWGPAVCTPYLGEPVKQERGKLNYSGHNSHCS